MAKLRDPVVDQRVFQNMFVCMKCNSKMRALPQKVKAKKIKCRRCGSKALRQKSKEIRVITGSATK